MLERAAKAGLEIEASDDGEHWKVLDQGAPFFRRWGTQNTEFSLGRVVAGHLRVTIAEGPGGPLPLSSVRLQAAPEQEPALIPVGARIVSRGEYAGISELTVALDGRVVMSVTDMSIRKPFDGLLLANSGGIYRVRSVGINGSR